MESGQSAAGHGGFGLLGQYDLQQMPFIFMPFIEIATARRVLCKKNEFFIFNAFIHLLKSSRFFDHEHIIKIKTIFCQRRIPLACHKREARSSSPPTVSAFSSASLHDRDGSTYFNGLEKRHTGGAGHADASM